MNTICLQCQATLKMRNDFKEEVFDGLNLMIVSKSTRIPNYGTIAKLTGHIKHKVHSNNRKNLTSA